MTRDPSEAPRGWQALQGLFVAVAMAAGLSRAVLAEIPRPADAPAPLSPQASHATFRVPAGFKVQLVAAEPLIHEPSGVCWDAKGRLFVSELHGYNLEGQFDIEELNKTGKLDTEVRRINAPPEAKAKADAATYGTIKLLADTDGDGVMDRATVFADHLPACYGICAARDGIIATAAPQIIFLPTGTVTAWPRSARCSTRASPWASSSGASTSRSGATTTGSTPARARAAAGSPGRT